MNKHRTFSILRATAATGQSIHILPSPQAPVPTDLHGADPLADIALRACIPMLDAFSTADRDRTGLIIGTAFGCLETDRLFDRSRRESGGRYASPAAFSRTLPSTVAAEIALKLSLRGPSLIVSKGDASAAIALRRAASWMEHLGLAYCIAGGIEWREPSGCRAALLLLGQKSPGVGTLHVSTEWNRGEESLTRLTNWIIAPQRSLIGSGIELMAVAAP